MYSTLIGLYVKFALCYIKSKLLPLIIFLLGNSWHLFHFVIPAAPSPTWRPTSLFWYFPDYSLTAPFTLLLSSSHRSPSLEKQEEGLSEQKLQPGDSVIDKSLLASDRGLLSSNHRTNWLKCLLVFMHISTVKMAGLITAKEKEREIQRVSALPQRELHLLQQDKTHRLYNRNNPETCCK